MDVATLGLLLTRLGRLNEQFLADHHRRHDDAPHHDAPHHDRGDDDDDNKPVPHGAQLQLQARCR